MPKRIMSFAFVLLVGSLAIAQSQKLTKQQYWANTGLSGADLESLPYFQKDSCTNNIKNFRACIRGLSSLASHGKNSLVIVPRSTASSDEIVKDFGPLVFAKAPDQKSDSSVNIYKYWQTEKARRDKIDLAITRLFQDSSQKNSIDFKQIVESARENGLSEPSKEASFVAEALNNYLIEAVDPHSHFDPTEELIADNAGETEEFFGIGVELALLNGRLVIQSPMEGSPALAAGIHRNDVVTMINGETLEKLDLTDIVAKIRGPLGTKVVLHILRDGKESDIPIVRAKIVMENVTAKLITNAAGRKIGYMKLRNFVDSTSCRVIAMKIFEYQRSGAKSLILDLRGNGGGLLQQGVCIGNLFVGDKVIVKVKNLQSGEMQSVGTVIPSPITALPLFLLIDAGSASASEIVAGALQDYNRALLIGEKSFGKATAQTPGPVKVNGKEVFKDKITLYTTIERFYQPSGRTNQIQGLIPDLTVPLKPDATDEERFALREADLFPNALEAIGTPWKQPRPGLIKKIQSCMSKTGSARKEWTAHQNDAISPDFQLLSAEDAANCAE